MKTQKWKRALSTILAGTMVLTSLSAAMTAFASEGDTSEYDSYVAAAAEAAKDPVFDVVKIAGSSTGTFYDNQEGDMKTFAEANVSAMKLLNAQDPEAYGDYRKAREKVFEDVKAAMGDAVTEAKEAVFDGLEGKNAYEVYPYFIDETWTTVEAIPDSLELQTSKFQFATVWATNEWTQNTDTKLVGNLKKALTNFKTQVTDEFLNYDVASATPEELDKLYRDKYSAINGVTSYPEFMRIEIADKVAPAQAKLNEVGIGAAQPYLDAAKAFQAKYPTPADITTENYEQAKQDFTDLKTVKNALYAFINNDVKAAADAIYNQYNNSAGIKAAIAKIISEKADEVTAVYGVKGEKVTEENAAQAQEAVSAVEAIFNDTATFGSMKYDAACKEAIAKLDPIQGEIDFLNGEGASFVSGIADLKAQYGGDNFAVTIEQAEEVNNQLATLKGMYDALTDDAKALERVADAYADYEMMVAAVTGPLEEGRLNAYTDAVNAAKEQWFEGDAVKALTMADYAGVRESLAAMNDAYAMLTDAQKADEAVVALKVTHDALQAAYDAALAEGVYTPSDFTYPEGLDAETAAEAITAIDTVLTNPKFVSLLANALGVEIPMDTDLRGLVETFVTNNLYTDSMVTTIVKTLYPMLYDMVGSMASIASLVGLYVTPSNAAGQISDDYAAAKEAIAAGGSTWVDSEGNSTVDWDAVTWGVEAGNKDSFYAALGQGLNGLNALLNVILNDIDSGSGLAGLAGIPGYQTSIVPLLTALGCSDIPTPDEFKADTSTAGILRTIIELILNRVYEICEAPVQELTSLLPQLAYFFNADGLKNILSPLVIKGTGFAGSVNINLWDTLSATVDLSDLNGLLSGLIGGAIQDFTWVDIDFAYLAGLGTGEKATDVAGNEYMKVTADNSKVAVALIEYVGKVLNANAGLIKAQIPAIEDPELQAVVNGLLDTILKADPDKLVVTIIHFLAPTCEIAITPYNNPTIEKVEFVYPEGVNYGEDAYAAAPATIDALLAGFVNLSDTVGNLIYTDANIDSIADALVNLDPTVAQILSALGITAEELQAAADATKAIEVTDKASFVEALTTVLSPFDEVLALVLAGQELDVFGYTVTAGDAYNSVVIPLLEVLGCTDVMSYADYQAAVVKGASPLEAILNQVFDRLDEILASPVDSLTKMLPNLAYFLDSNNLSVMLKNALAPLNTLLAHVDVDLVAVLSDILVALDIPAVDDIDNNLAGLVNMLLASLNVNIQLPAIDLHALASYGTAEQYESAMVIGGKNVMATRIVADQADVTGAVIGYLYNVLADETNKEVILGLLGDSATMVGGILDNLLGGGVAGFTNALFELLGLPVKPADGGNGSNGGSTGDNDNVETGDAAIATVAGAALLAAGAVIVLSRKKRA